LNVEISMSVIHRILGLRRESPQVSAKERSPEKDFSQRFSEVPDHLVIKVNGSLDESVFRNAGRGATDQIVENVNLKRAKTILDFGCGLGRVLLPLMERAPQAKFVAYDIDPMMIPWAEHLALDSRCRFVNSTLGLPGQRRG